MRIFIFFLLLSFSLGYFFFQIHKHLNRVSFGRPDNREDHKFERCLFLLKQVILHKKLRDYPLTGYLHALLMWGFVILSLSSLDMAFQGLYNKQIPIFENSTYLFIRDAFVLFALIGVIGLLFRRLFFKPSWLHNSLLSYIILILILIIVLTEYLYFKQSLKPLIQVYWWVHFITIFSFLYIIPNSKHLHLILAPFNIYWHSTRTKGSLESIELDLEKEQTCGVKTVEDFTWKQLLDAFSCVKCGRCHGRCPSEQSKEYLKPKRINGYLRTYMEKNPSPVNQVKVVGELFRYDFIWSCTTCGGCNDACPISIDHISKIIDMRRYIVSEKVNLTPEITQVFEGVEKYGNPWGKERNNTEQLRWATELGIPTIIEKPDAEYLFFLGCKATYDLSARKAAHAFAKILQSVKVDFAILGVDELCCGETVRRMGNELLFQKSVLKNISILNKFNVKKIITTCPHCFNTFKNEYPEFGGRFKVIPHSVFLKDLILNEKLTTKKVQQNLKITFHDPCYLSHFNNIFTEQRKILSAIPGVNLVEMQQCKDKSFCCGAGGGRYWRKASDLNPISKNRTHQALSTEAELIITACPYCKYTFDNELKEIKNKKNVEVIDIAEFLEGHNLLTTL